MAKKTKKQEIEEAEAKVREVQLKAKLMKIKLAAIGPATPEARRGHIQDTKNPSATIHGSNTQTQNRLRQEDSFIKKKKKIYPKNNDATVNKDFRQSLAKDHGHTILMKGNTRGVYRSASLENQQGKYAKYWLLNAKETNGNGWGIAAHSAKTNMAKFIGRPLVITSSSWHGEKIAGKYGKTFDHPYVPTNDLTTIFNHQEQYRVGSIVDIQKDKNDDYYATIEMLPKFANMTLPPFCSPAIYQLDAKEAEGQISKWEALHLAALDENPAYGARIALLKGTCVGTNNECKVQFKSAKLQEGGIICTKGLKAKLQKIAYNGPGYDVRNKEFDKAEADAVRSKKIPPSRVGERIVKDGVFAQRSPRRKSQFHLKMVGKNPARGIIPKDQEILNKKREVFPEHKDLTPRYQKTHEVGSNDLGFTNLESEKLGKLKRKLKLASQGEQNMTYQESKKIKIHKKKHPEVRKAKSEFFHANIDAALRGIHSSVIPERQSTFLSTKGDYIGGGDDHTDTIKSIFNTQYTQEDKGNDGPVTRFSTEHGLPRVQRRITRRGERISVGIHSKINSSQLRSLRDIEKGGSELGYVVGADPNTGETGDGYRDMTKALRRNKFL